MILRTPVESDLAFLCGLLNDAPLQALLLGPPKPRTIEMTRSWVDDKVRNPDFRFFVFDVEERCAGYVQIAAVDWVHRTGILGICIGAGHRGAGLGRRAVEALQDYARDHLALRKLTLTVRGDNAAAIALYDKLGYRTVGVFDDHVWIGEGQFEKVVIMEIFL